MPSPVSIRQLAPVGFGLAVVAALWFLFAPTALGGPADYVVTAGTSMEPRFHTGDLAVVRRAGDYRVGEIVAYRSRALNTVVLHRIIAKAGGRYLFRGDNNDFVDPERVPRDRFVGRLWIHVPQGARYLGWLASGWTAALIGGLATLALVGRKTSRRRRRREAAPAFGLARPTLRTAALAAAAALALSLALAVFAFAHAARHAVSAPAGYRVSGRFTYDGPAAPGEVYPRGRLATGDPVFLELAHAVSVRFDYRFSAAGAHRLQGTLALSAQLRASNGWTRTVAVAPPRTFRGDRATVRGTLQLDGIPALLQHLEDTTGVANLTYALTFLARVRAGGVLEGTPFRAAGLSPSLAFVVTPDQLQLPPPQGTADPLRPHATGAVQTRRSAPSALSLWVGTIPVATARRIGLLGAFVSLAALLVLVVLLDEAPRLSEQERIRARYRDRLVPVSHAAGRVVEIATMEMLVKLAERYDRMILHERSEHADSYRFSDDGVTYVYRVGDPPAEPRRRLEAVPDLRKAS